jgi:hypothetical protein
MTLLFSAEPGGIEKIDERDLERDANNAYKP